MFAQADTASQGQAYCPVTISCLGWIRLDLMSAIPAITISRTRAGRWPASGLTLSATSIAITVSLSNGNGEKGWILSNRCPLFGPLPVETRKRRGWVDSRRLRRSRVAGGHSQTARFAKLI
jgi:hypothetical protein